MIGAKDDIREAEVRLPTGMANDFEAAGCEPAIRSTDGGPRGSVRNKATCSPWDRAFPNRFPAS
jgi:hypothetical protein